MKVAKSCDVFCSTGLLNNTYRTDITVRLEVVITRSTEEVLVCFMLCCFVLVIEHIGAHCATAVVDIVGTPVPEGVHVLVTANTRREMTVAGVAIEPRTPVTKGIHVRLTAMVGVE